MTKKVEISGKVARFNFPIKASEANSFLQQKGISSDKIWYVMISVTEGVKPSIALFKYNQKQGVDVKRFCEDLFKVYQSRPIGNDVRTVLESYTVNGDTCWVGLNDLDIKMADGKTKLIQKVADDLARLLK